MDFVQDEVRYLGLEGGVNSFKSHSPDKVLNQRFGDCKDKSLLAVELLNALNIEAYPALVNTSGDERIHEELPRPSIFDHCIVYLPNSTGSNWIDPTNTGQGGGHVRAMSDYGQGFVLRPSGEPFVNIRAGTRDSVRVTEIFTIPEIVGGATLAAVTKYYGRQADYYRSYFESYRLKEIEKSYLDFYAREYGAISTLEPLQVQDDRANNVFTITEEYRIKDI